MRRTFFLTAALTLAAAGVPGLTAAQANAQSSQVLLVCNGSTQKCPTLPSGAGPYYTTVQSAVNAAVAGDWILIYPGVYHEQSSQWPTAGVWIQTPDLHIIGMNRNDVIIDGSNGTAAAPCPSAEAQQNLTPRNGIEVYKASGVTIENLTVCDYLGDAAGDENYGNEIWWNGGWNTGTNGLGAYTGSYLTTSSEYAPTSSQPQDLAQYGFYADNTDGPGLITDSYASNMADAAYYIGACEQACNTTVSDDVGTNSALGYSGTNSGGKLVIEDSIFNLNHAGIIPNSMNSEDPIPPQNGLCPGSTTASCSLIEDNVITDNNNVNAPAIAFTGPVGVGVQIAGGQYDTVADNVISDQGSWGVVTSDAPDPNPPAPGADCQGGIQNDPEPGFCDFPALGNLVYSNVFSGNGFFGNQTNGDLATETLASYTPRNCFYGNVDAKGLTSAPANIESSTVDGQPCSGAGTGNDPELAAQLACAVSIEECSLSSGANYPQEGTTKMLPIPGETTMPNPCNGVPSDASSSVFCSSSGGNKNGNGNGNGHGNG
jgi:hypothetical protein